MLIDVWVNCPSEEVANEITEALLRQRLAAASNRYPEITSRYHWNGQIENAREVPLRLKTWKDRFDALVEAVQDLHPYDTPSIQASEVVAASPDYLSWVRETTRPA